MRRTWFNVCNIAHWLSLAIWIAALASAGVAATGVFGKLLHTDLLLNEFASYDHSAHGRLAAGMVMEPIFTFVDLVQLVAGAVVALTLALQLMMFDMPLKRPANLIRTVCVLIAAILLVVRMATITPEMNRELRAYWAAAKAGQVEEAGAHQQKFDRRHPVVSKMFGATFALLLVTVAASAVSLGHYDPMRKGGLETPQLLTRR